MKFFLKTKNPEKKGLVSLQGYKSLYELLFFIKIQYSNGKYTKFFLKTKNPKKGSK